MNSPTMAILVTAVLVLVTVAGDYCLKRATLQAHPFASWWFAGGVVLYVVTAPGWMFVMRNLTFSAMGAVYAALTVLFLTLIGHLVLGESLRWSEVMGVVLALVSVGLLARFA